MSDLQLVDRLSESSAVFEQVVEEENTLLFFVPVAPVQFSDIAGEYEAKEVLMEIVNYIYYPQKYRDIRKPMNESRL